MGKYEALLKEMFAEMVVPQNADLIPKYYHPDMLLYTNQMVQTYEQFLADHTEYYDEAQARSYVVEYDEETFVEGPDGVACRVWITVGRGDDEPTRIEVVLIAKYVDDKLHRMWELTLPNWSTLESFAG